MLEKVALRAAGIASFCFWAVSGKNCLNMLRDLSRKKLTCPCNVPACATIDGKHVIVSHLFFFLNECSKTAISLQGY